MNPHDFSDETPELRRAAQLISSLFDERISVQEQAELESLLVADPRVCRMYVCFTHLHAGLYEYASALGSIDGSDMSIEQETPDLTGDALMNETMVLPAITHAASDGDHRSFDEELFAPAPYSPPHTPEIPHTWYSPGGIAALLVLALGIAVYLLVASKHPVRPPTVARSSSPAVTAPTVAVEIPPPAATLDLASKPVWQINNIQPLDSQFKVGQSLMLISGAVQLQLKGGGRLVVEGPADLQFLSYTCIALHQGKIAALVPGGGLVVQCPKGSVTDLGTEFGLNVYPDGATEVAVFQGSVSASLSSTTGITQNTRDTLLTVGQAAVISDTTIKRSPDGAIPQRYILSLKNDSVTSLDVTDLISGGDGTTHRRGIAIDSITGAIGDLAPTGNRNGDGKYHRVVGYPVIDGTFVPDGSLDQMVVDSAGDRFKFTTACNQTHNLIETGGQIRWNDAAGISTTLDGVDYSTAGHGIICTHSNNALTLDLDAVRRLYPDREIARFKCRFGNSYVNGRYGALKTNPLTGAFVLINGQSRYQQPRFSNQEGSFSVDLPLSRNDRFLTLAATDANTDIFQDWILWTDAELDFAAVK